MAQRVGPPGFASNRPEFKSSKISFRFFRILNFPISIIKKNKNLKSFKINNTLTLNNRLKKKL